MMIVDSGTKPTTARPDRVGSTMGDRRAVHLGDPGRFIRMSDFVIREWTLDPSPTLQAPRHIHHQDDEAFVVLAGRLVVEDSGVWHDLGPGDHHVVSAGSVHTFATVGDEPVRILCVMSEEIDRLVTALQDPNKRADRLVWAAHQSSVVDLV
jgi:mannose-6-phosphate isomerase-like protein (cupin superfamily)